MHGNMWVESEVSQGSRFYFTVTSQISPTTLDVARNKMQQFQKRNILYMNSRYDVSGLEEQIRDLGLKPTISHSVKEISDKASCPHIDTIVIDSLEVVRAKLGFVAMTWCSPDYRQSKCGSTSTCDMSLLSCSHQRPTPC